MQKVILITGASSGIGAATANTLLKAGHKVIVTARREQPLKAFVDKWGDHLVLPVVCDVSNISNVNSVVEQALEKFGTLDVVFANAGTGLSHAGVENGDAEEWASMLKVNVNGLLYTAKATLPALRKSKGQFILTSSIAGKIALKGSVYGASKWFAYGFGQNLAAEMAEWGGRCSTICPGMVNTPFFDEPKPDKLIPEDIADAVLHAISADKRCDVREIVVMPTA